MIELLLFLTVGIGLILVYTIQKVAVNSYSTRVFQVTIISFLLWAIINYFSVITKDGDLVLFLVRAVMFNGVLLVMSIFEFGNFFPNDISYLKNRARYIGIFVYTLLAISSLTPLIISEVLVNQFGAPNPVFGPLIGLYVSLIVGGLAFEVIATNRKKQNLNAKQINQVNLVNKGLFYTGILAIITNILFLVIWDSSGLVPYGPFFTLILIFYISKAIVQYQLFDIRVILGKLTYYFVLALFPFLIYLIISSFEFSLLRSYGSATSLILAYLLSLSFVVLYNNLNTFLSENITSKIINPGFDPAKELNTLNQKVSKLLEYNSLMDVGLKTLARTLRTDKIAIVLKTETQEFRVSKKFQEVELGTLDSIILEGKLNHRMLDLEVQESDLSTVDAKIRQLGVHLLIPLIKGSKVIGVILIGERFGNSLYSSLEKDFLLDVSNSLSVALDRALLYEDARDFNNKLQKEIEVATDELRHKNKALEDNLRKEQDMMDILGHELRTPLGTARNAIVMIDKLVKKEALDREKLDKWMKIALENIRREKETLQTILSSAKLENDKYSMSEEKVEVVKIVQDAVDVQKRDADVKKLDLVLEAQDHDLFTYTDKAAFQQIVDNLISNAIKYTAEGSINVWVKKEESYIHVGVTDTGEGISKENIPLIGKKFFRVNPYLEGSLGGHEVIRPGGTGIGMFVVKGMLKMMGSKLEIESEVGKGSTFSFKIKEYSPSMESETDSVHEVNTSGDRLT